MATGVSAVALVAGLFAGASSGAAATATAAGDARADAGVRTAPGVAYVPNELLVRFGSDLSGPAVDRLNADLGATTVRSYHIVPGLRLVRLPAGLAVTAAIARYRRLPGVQYAEPDYVTHVDETVPNDPSFSLQYDWQNTGQIGGTIDADVDATDAWDITTGSSSVAVGVIDTGVQIDPSPHPDLAGNLWRNLPECNGTPGVDDEGDGYVDDCFGIDAINHDSDPNDDFNHGTHVAGTIGAVGNNGVGVTGFNWDVTIVPCKSHDNTGNGTNDSLLECLQFMKDWKARGLNIVATNNSYGGCNEACDYSQSLYDAIKDQMRSGILYVASAGNDARDNDVNPKYPTNYFLPNVIGVAATTQTDDLASFSNFGKHTVSVGAPGQSVYSTIINSGYAYLSGTSMASPHVVGLAALLAAWNPSLDWRGIRNLILAGGDIKTGAAKTITGRRINANGSMNCTDTAVFAPLRPLPSTGGGQQPVAALNINCAVPAGGLTVKITPGNTTLRLRDDGKRADISAGDGIYSANWSPCAPGTYTFSYSNGSADTITVTGLTPCIRVRPDVGPPGGAVRVAGLGFQANEMVQIRLGSKPLAEALTDNAGAFTARARIPFGATDGLYEMIAIGQTSGVVGTTVFRVQS